MLALYGPSHLYPSALLYFFCFFNDTATTEIYTLSLHDALPICATTCWGAPPCDVTNQRGASRETEPPRPKRVPIPTTPAARPLPSRKSRGGVRRHHESSSHFIFNSSAPTAELTRRRESKHPPPHQLSCERRSRRSRPTICSAQLGNPHLFFVNNLPRALLFFKHECIAITA